MKAMPLPFEQFQGKGVLDFSSSTSDSQPPQNQHLHHHHNQQQQQQKWNQNSNKENCYVGSTEPTSVLDTRRSPSPPTSSSTLSAAAGGGDGGGGGGSGSTDTTTCLGTTAAAVYENISQTPLEESKCGPALGMEDWESVLSESPGQEQSILRLIMSDIEDPSLGLNKLLQSGSGSDQQDLEFSAGFHDVVDQGGYDGFEPNTGNLQQQQHMGMDEKPQIFNPQMVMNQNQAQFTQNPALFMPLTYTQLQEHHLLSPPPPKRLNSGGFGPNYPVQRAPFSNPGQELLVRAQQQHQHQQQQQQQLQFLPQHLQQQRPTMLVKENMLSPAEGTKEMMNQNQNQQQLQQAAIDQLFNAAELIETGNPALAQGILARLNHQLSPIGKPFQRAAFYFKEALQLLLHINTSSNSSNALSPFSLIFKIGAYKSFSEISPVLQFANFTCNQAILEAVEGFNRVHVIDFDIGYGGQWASFMQEIALRNCGAPSFKITAFISSSTHDEFEIGFTRENLKHFASELNLSFELELVSLEALNSGSWGLPLHVSEGVAVAVNLPIGSFSNNPLSLTMALGFVKQLSPKIVVSLDRGSDRTDVPFAHQVIQALHSYSGLLESLDAVNVNPDALQKIERYLLQPGIEKIVTGRHLSPKRTPPWRTLFSSSGFSPLTFSNFTESQAECLVQRTPVGGFHIEKRQSSLVLCWQRKDLISVSVWRC
ncbi:PREDICTED: LOW QUALITY PROTEIN: scarecrow-like protein 22 [Prunus mume]|uniref:LOW QUALITY PROTEIN: scarecrow-like protein 22 n=1 Tax=Prunus mume TaxID=102107 RepID=A0ABM1LS72_PRUMU|nr:PREDICTED: LOW QUALITY PROTEIN: scarecrow-like protein 22 [Prunus mume]